MKTSLLELDFYCFFSPLLYQFTNNKLACYSNKTSGIESDDCHHRTIVFLGHKLTSRDHRSSAISLSLLHPLFPTIVPATEFNVYQYFVTYSIEKNITKISHRRRRRRKKESIIEKSLLRKRYSCIAYRDNLM